MARWLANGILKVFVASSVIWFVLAAFENGLANTLSVLSDVAWTAVAFSGWGAWHLVLTAAAFALACMVIYDTATKDD